MVWFFRHKACSKSYTEAMERIATLEGQLRVIDSDQRDLWDRFNRFEGRQKKRVQRADAEELVRVSPINEPLKMGQLLMARRNGA